MALRALDGSANACQWATTLKVAQGTDDSFAIGCWVRTSAYEATASVFARLMAWRQTSNIDNCQMQIMTGNNSSQFTDWDRRSGNVGTADIYSAAAPDNKWRFSIVRVISTTSMRSQTIAPTGALDPKSNVTDLSAVDTSVVDELVFGWQTASAAVGDIAEFWIAGPDPFKPFTDIPKDLMYHIARNGPFAYDPVAGSLQFYASFEQGARTDMAGHYIAPNPLTFKSGTQTLRAVDHPPLAPGYWRPSEPRTVGFI